MCPGKVKTNQPFPALANDAGQPSGRTTSSFLTIRYPIRPTGWWAFCRHNTALDGGASYLQHLTVNIPKGLSWSLLPFRLHGLAQSDRGNQRVRQHQRACRNPAAITDPPRGSGRYRPVNPSPSPAYPGEEATLDLYGSRIRARTPLSDGGGNCGVPFQNADMDH